MNLDFKLNLLSKRTRRNNNLKQSSEVLPLMSGGLKITDWENSLKITKITYFLFTKLFMVIGGCWFFQTLALLDIRALDYIGKIFTLIQVCMMS